MKDTVVVSLMLDMAHIAGVNQFDQVWIGEMLRRKYGGMSREDAVKLAADKAVEALREYEEECLARCNKEGSATL